MTVTHKRRGTDVLITVETETLVERDGELVRERRAMTMFQADWYRNAREILKECSNTQRLIDPDVYAERIEDSLATKVTEAKHTDHRVSCMRAASSVLHAVAEMIMTGNLERAIVAWDRTTERTVIVELSTPQRDISGTFEMGRGSVSTSITERKAG